MEMGSETLVIFKLAPFYNYLPIISLNNKQNKQEKNYCDKSMHTNRG